MTSGSDKRDRQKSLSARFNDEEEAQVRAKADRAGVTVASLIRSAVLDGPEPRATRRPTVATETVSLMVHALGPVADSLRQIAAHPGNGDDPRLAAALDQIAEMSFLCLQAMGRVPHRPAKPFRVAASFPEPLSDIWTRAAGELWKPPPLSAPYPDAAPT